jgi:hypothetical protein
MVCQTTKMEYGFQNKHIFLVQRCIDETTLVHSYACTGRVSDGDRLCQTVDTGCNQIRYHIFGEQSQRTIRSRPWQWIHGVQFPLPQSQRSSDRRGHHEVRLLKIAVLNSYEYVDTTAIAAILGVEFDSRTIRTSGAQALYKYMLRLVHTVWSRNSHMYGYSYDIVANNST